MALAIDKPGLVNLEIPADALNWSQAFQLKDDETDAVIPYTSGSTWVGTCRATYADDAALLLQFDVAETDPTNGTFTLSVAAATPTSGLDLSGYTSQDDVTIGKWSLTIEEPGDPAPTYLLRGSVIIVQHVEDEA